MIEQLLNEVVTIAVNAGQAIMLVYDDKFIEVTSKVDASPLTQADLASDRAISAGLLALNLAWPLLSEESAQISYEDRKNWNRFWLIDPLDGTKEFIKRNGEFTVNIALIENGQPILGVVYAPVLDVCYFAASGVGAFVSRGSDEVQPITVKSVQLSEVLKVVASRSHSDERTTSLLQKLGQYECISMGSSLKLCLVAEGAAHIYPRLGPTMEWDTAAAHAVVKCAGGKVCDWSGAELLYNKSDLHNPEFLVIDKEDSELLAKIISQ
jgi:3'(2'), 5'-bisphosphate nucleotidase